MTCHSPTYRYIAWRVGLGYHAQLRCACANPGTDKSTSHHNYCSISNIKSYCTSREVFFWPTDCGVCSRGCSGLWWLSNKLLFIFPSFELFSWEISIGESCSITNFLGFDSSEECLACSFFESCVGTPPDAEPTEEELLPLLDRVVVRGARWWGGCVCTEGMPWRVDDSVGRGDTREGALE